MILAWILASAALIMFVACGAYLVAIALKRFLPSVNGKVIDARLVSKRSDKTQLIMYVVHYKIDSTREGTFKYLFLYGDAESVSESGRYAKLQQAFSPGKSIRFHYVPGFEGAGLIPESPVFRVETAILVVGFLVAGMIVASATFFLL